jgi:hypothetical protein
MPENKVNIKISADTTEATKDIDRVSQTVEQATNKIVENDKRIAQSLKDTFKNGFKDVLIRAKSLKIV